MNLLPALEEIELFARLSPEARGALAAVARVLTVDDGQVIMLEGDSGAPVFYVLHGVIRVFRTSMDGREQTVTRLGRGEAFNVPAAFAGGSAPASAAAVGPVELLAIPCPDFARIVSETPEIALAVLRDLAQKLYHLTDLTRDLGLFTVRARLARFLLNAHASSERGAGRSPRGSAVCGTSAPVRWTHQEIAAEIGTVREVVSRTMRAFVKEGLIGLDRHRIMVLDREALACEAGL